jgi:hypothetical protein
MLMSNKTTSEKRKMGRPTLRAHTRQICLAVDADLHTYETSTLTQVLNYTWAFLNAWDKNPKSLPSNPGQQIDLLAALCNWAHAERQAIIDTLAQMEEI